MPKKSVDGYGINVAQFTLTKQINSPPSLSFENLHVAGYPLQDILYRKKINPIRQNRQKDVEAQPLRYFHFLSNSMHWVEVRASHGTVHNPRLTLCFRKLLRVTMEKTLPDNMTIHGIMNIGNILGDFYVGSIGNHLNMGDHLTLSMHDICVRIVHLS
jgi:hypothetical protein